jgi:hypothetical protein
MNTFKKKSLYAAVAGLGALTAAGMAEAVNVNPDGLGQVLIYPYYTVRSTASGAAYNSLISVVNSTNSAKAVKVRFLEGNNSREVLDFNLFLSHNDVWVAAVLPTADGAGIFTPDNSCTMPQVSKDPANPTNFVNFAYTGNSADGGDTSLDRTREGYVEIIEMADILNGTPTWTTVTHVNSVPPCKASILQSPNLTTVNPQLNTDTVPGTGGLFGGITLISALAPSDVATEATALDAFSVTKQLFPEGSILPNLANVNPAVSVVTSGSTTWITDWTFSGNPADAVSAVLMHNNVYNEFVLDTPTKSGTDWVVTMPTKWSYYGGGQIVDSNGDVIGVALTPGQTLFQRNFVGGKACDDVGITRFDREENTVQSQTTFSPPPPTQTDSICYEANVITFNNSNVLASKNVANIPTTFQNGYVGLNFAITSTGRHQLVGGASTTFDTTTGGTGGTLATQFVGLPTVGFAVETFNNGTLTDSNGTAVNSAYAGRFAHRFTRSIAGVVVSGQ